MKVKFKFIFLIIPMFFLWSCIEKIDFNSIGEVRALTVDAQFTNDRVVQTIYFTETSDVGSSLIRRVNPRNVIVKTKSGKSYVFDKIETGEYAADLILNENELYQLTFEYQSNNYASSWEGLNIGGSIDSVFYEFERNNVIKNGITQEERGYQVSLRLNNSDRTGAFYRWETNTTYEVQSLLLEGCCTRCWLKKRIKPQEIKLGTFEGATKNFNLVYLPYNNDFKFLYQLEITQYSLTPSIYKYWESLQTLLSQNGSIFQSIPFKLKGNITSTDSLNSTDDVYGLFSLADVRKSKIFIQRLGIEGIPTPFEVTPEGDCRVLFPNSVSEIPDDWPN